MSKIPSERDCAAHHLAHLVEQVGVMEGGAPAVLCGQQAFLKRSGLVTVDFWSARAESK